MVGASVKGSIKQLPFVGRADELATLQAAVDDARSGRTAAVFVGGDGGIGKTRLLAEFAASVDSASAAVLRGACIDINNGPPFWPLIDALRRLLREPEVEWAHEAIAPWRRQLHDAFPAAEWAVPARLAPTQPEPSEDHPVHPDHPVRVLRALPASLPTADETAGAGDGAERMPTLELLFRVLTSLAGHRPLVLVIEDLHLADRSTRDLLVYLLASLSHEPILLVGSYRTDEVERGAPLRALLDELRRHSLVRRFELRPLSEQDVLVLVDGALGDEAAPGLAGRVWELSRGHPLFAEEILHASVALPGGVAHIPADLRDLLADRVAALPTAAQQVVRAVAAGEEPVDHRLLLAVVDLPEADLLAALRAAIDGCVLADDPGGAGYRFRHVLIKHVVYGNLLQGERLGLHRSHALAIAASPGVADSAKGLLAHHWQHAEDWPRAFAATVEAARRAERLHAFAEAYRYWAGSLDLHERTGDADGGLDRATLLDNAARAAHLCGEHDGAVGLMATRLELAGGPAVDGALRHRQAQYLLAAGRVREAVEAYRDAAAAFSGSGGGTLEQADTLAGYAEVLLLTGRYGESRDEAERALALANAAGSRSGMVQALAALGYSKAFLRDHDAGLGDLRRALKIAEATTGRPEDVGRTFMHLAELLSGPLNRLAEGVRVALEGAGRVDALGVGRTFGVSLRAIAVNGMFRLGQWRETEQVVADALAWRPTGSQAVEIRLARCRILVGQGRFAEAHADLDAAEALTVEAVGPRYKAPLVTLRAGLALFEGRYEDAREAVALGLDVAEAGSDDTWVLAPLVWHGLRAEAEDNHETRRRRGQDDAFVRRLRGHVEHLQAKNSAPVVTDGVRGYVDLCAAEMAKVDGAADPAAWARAAETWEHLANPYPAAYARLQQAEALFAERTRNAEATRHLVQAYWAACRLGAVPFRRQAEALAARARIPLTPPAADANFAVTTAIDASAVTDTGVASATLASRPVGQRPAGRAPAGQGSRAQEHTVLQRLTGREFAVLKEIADGRTNRQIATKLFISEKTVSAHVSHILNKLEVRTRVQASAIYLHSQRD
jgi:DNA-binding CsgD family transcriptional regulator/tetratricopeptide (TPR) repeat protein